MSDLRTRNRGYVPIPETDDGEDSDLHPEVFYSSDTSSIQSQVTDVTWLTLSSGDEVSNQAGLSDDMQGTSGATPPDVGDEDDSNLSMEVNVGSGRASIESHLHPEIKLTVAPDSGTDDQAHTSTSLFHTSGAAETGQDQGGGVGGTGLSGPDTAGNQRIPLAGFHGLPTQHGDQVNQDMANNIALLALVITIERLLTRIVPSMDG